MKLSNLVNNTIVKSVIKFIFSFLNDKQIIKLQYRIVLRRKLNLENPKRFTEKIQWYKLNYRTELMTQCADKYLVKKYIHDKGFEDTLVKLYQVCENFNEIDFDKLPNSFVIKSNKGSGTNLFIKDKKSIDIKSLRNQVEKWNTVNTVLMGREWAYNNIKHKIVVEELLIDKNSNLGGLNDYKFFCFNGSIKYVLFDMDRGLDHKRNFYDDEWNLLNVQSIKPYRSRTEVPIPRPGGFEYMKEIAMSIAKDFPFVRVDFYWVNGKVYFGEITFYPWSGCAQFSPDNFDYKMGNLLELPSKTCF